MPLSFRSAAHKPNIPCRLCFGYGSCGFIDVVQLVPTASPGGVVSLIAAANWCEGARGDLYGASGDLDDDDTTAATTGQLGQQRGPVGGGAVRFAAEPVQACPGEAHWAIDGRLLPSAATSVQIGGESQHGRTSGTAPAAVVGRRAGTCPASVFAGRVLVAVGARSGTGAGLSAGEQPVRQSTLASGADGGVARSGDGTGGETVLGATQRPEGGQRTGASRARHQPCTGGIGDRGGSELRHLRHCLRHAAGGTRGHRTVDRGSSQAPDGWCDCARGRLSSALAGQSVDGRKKGKQQQPRPWPADASVEGRLIAWR